jgi:molybdopterin molybdotransferase
VSLISLDEALRLLLADLPSLGSERVPLGEALGRTLAEPVIASHDQPAEPRATMDGIAVSDASPGVGTTWQLIGNVPAGAGAPPPLKPAKAIRIATGGVVPEGATRVLPQEILQFLEASVTLVSEPGSASFVRRTGADFAAGEPLLERGVRIGPGELGLIAAANCAFVSVVRAPRIGVCTAGDELVPPGSELLAGQSIDSATYSLSALIRCWGGVVQATPLLPDDLPRVASALAAAAKDNDIVVCIGGASVGARDLMRPAARAIGTRILFEGIAVQPGKPCWHGRDPDSALILGLPGNPSSALVCAHLLLHPLIEALMGRLSEPRFRRAYLTASLPAAGEREQYLRASAVFDGAGRLLVTPVADQDSGLQANLAKAQLLIRRLPRAEAVEPGAMVEVLELTGT